MSEELKIPETVYGNLSEAMYTLNRLSDLIYRQDIDINDIDEKDQEKINTLLKSLTDINATVDEIKEDLNIKGDETVDIPKLNSDYRYSIGETCLLIDPFDNYRIFTLYDTHEKTGKPLDLSDGQKIYLVFKQGTKEIRISEYEGYNNSYINVDKENGQVLFKISKKHANEIMNFKNRTFYITRIYESYDSMTDSIVTADEEVMFSGFWADRNSTKETNLQETIDGLKDLLNQKDTAMQGMIDTINKLVEENTRLSEEIEELKKYQTIIDDLVDKGIIDEDGETTPFTGEIIDSKTVIIDNDNVSDKTKNIIDDVVNNGKILNGTKNFIRT